MSTILFILPFLVGYAILVICAERTLLALLQDWLGFLTPAVVVLMIGIGCWKIFIA